MPSARSEGEVYGTGIKKSPKREYQSHNTPQGFTKHNTVKVAIQRGLDLLILAQSADYLM